MSIGVSFPLDFDETLTVDRVFALRRRFNVEQNTRVLWVTQNPALAVRCHRTTQVINGVVSR